MAPSDPWRGGFDLCRPRTEEMRAFSQGTGTAQSGAATPRRRWWIVQRAASLRPVQGARVHGEMAAQGPTGEAAPRPDASLYAAFRSQRLFSSLDGLRGLSILAVLWHHVQIPAWFSGAVHGSRYGFLG